MTSRKLRPAAAFAALAAACTFASAPALASTAFGDLNNFDVFNDTTTPTHGFEIELDDVHSTDITYTFDWNHYGAPRITEDNADPAHPRVFVRYEARYDAASGTFSAYTAVPPAPPSPTNGHMCTDISVNIGCEHFGIGFYGAPTRVTYHWLVEDPLMPGTLVLGPVVNVATPTFVYSPAIPQVQPAQVQAVIEAPPPPEVPQFEFGDATWVKEIRTTTHNNAEVALADLVSDDPADPADRNWTNGEPDEVEVEWQIMQTEFNNPAGANNDLAGAPEDLPGGDEVVTRRYEFYQYSGPFDAETHEALCSKHPAIADPTDPSYKAECDPATVTILGDYIGAQMAGFEAAAALGMVDHLQDGTLAEPYTARTVVVGGNTPYAVDVLAGSLPAGLSIDPASGVLSGTPTAAGAFAFTLSARDADGTQVSKDFRLAVLDPWAVVPQYWLVVAPAGTGSGHVGGSGIDCGTTCDTLMDTGSSVSLSAQADAGSVFDGWSGPCVGTADCSFTLDQDTTVTATFNRLRLALSVSLGGSGAGRVTGSGIDCGATCATTVDWGSSVSLTATPAAGSVFSGWSGDCSGAGPCDLTMNAAHSATATFAPLTYTLSVTLAGPASAGTVRSSPAGISCGTDCQQDYAPGTLVKLTATAAKRHSFLGWSGACTGKKACTLTMSQARSVTATFK
ncbi:MAG: putative Ig domain-containing protein [Sinimarinibacterium sp.]|jgi:hypothetical protein